MGRRAPAGPDHLKTTVLGCLRALQKLPATLQAFIYECHARYAAQHVRLFTHGLVCLTAIPVGLLTCDWDRSHFQQVAHVLWSHSLGRDFADDAFPLVGVDMSAQGNSAVEGADFHVLGIL